MKANLLLAGREWAMLEVLCSEYALGCDAMTDAMLAYFSDILGDALPDVADPAEYAANRLFDSGKIKYWASSCQERITELQLQFDSLIALQRLIWIGSGADPETLPASGESGAAVMEHCRIFAGTGMDSICDALSSMSSGLFPKVFAKNLHYKISPELEAKLRGLCKPCRPKEICGRWIRNILSLYCSGAALRENSNLAADLDVLRDTGERLLDALRELHVNLERLSGRVEAASKEMVEANTQTSGLEE